MQPRTQQGGNRHIGYHRMTHEDIEQVIKGQLEVWVEKPEKGKGKEKEKEKEKGKGKEEEEGKEKEEKTTLEKDKEEVDKSKESIGEK